MLPEIAVYSTLFAALTALFTWLTLIRRAKVQYMTSMLYLHEFLSQPELGRARRHIRLNLHEKPFVLWTEDELNMANSVCASYDQAGMLIKTGVINKQSCKRFLTSSWGESICDQYEMLRPFLAAKQTPTRTGLDYFRDFTTLYRRACAYHRFGDHVSKDPRPCVEADTGYGRAEWSRQSGP